MHISKVVIENFKIFKEKFTLELNEGINILVGDNESGKSTILEAINLALSGFYQGKYLKNELTPYLFNFITVNEYLESVKSDTEGDIALLPEILIEIHFKGEDLAIFEGNGNCDRVNGCGISFKITFDDEYQEDYAEYIHSEGNIDTLPIEYYKIELQSFARQPILTRSIPIKSAFIDSSSNRYNNGSDIYISRIIRDYLEKNEVIKIAQAYRNMKEGFMVDPSIETINTKISDTAKISDKKVNLSVDFSSRNAWENSLITYIDDTPFPQIGKGEQCIVKTNLALGQKKVKEANILLLEEPENHLSHTKLNELIKRLESKVSENPEERKQMLIATHSSFVANKLGLENLILLNDKKTTRLNNLEIGTYNFFKKLPGYTTLRLILCKKAILVEGDSDELIVQRAYMDNNGGILPIENGIDVISVGMSFKMFIEIAVLLNKNIAIVTDNDKNYEKQIKKKYKKYEDNSHIKICADDRNELYTLEPQIADANKDNLDNLNAALGKCGKSEEDLKQYMLKGKTRAALKIFESVNKIKYPQYIMEAINEDV